MAGFGKMGTLVAAASMALSATGAMAEGTAGDVATVLSNWDVVMVRDGCDTSGFSAANGTPNPSGTSRGAIYAPHRVVSWVEETDEGLVAGKPCSVGMDVYIRMEEEGDSDDGWDTPTWPVIDN